MKNKRVIRMIIAGVLAVMLLTGVVWGVCTILDGMRGEEYAIDMSGLMDEPVTHN